MTAQGKVSSTTKAAAKGVPAEASGSLAGEKRQAISPAQRWLLIRDNAYARAQRHAFVGGNPFEDWLAAEREIDAQYATDFEGVFSLTNTAEILEQFKGVFAAYGLGQLSVDALLKKHREGMERLAALNRTVVNGTAELANQQTALLQDAVSVAVKTLQSFAQGRVGTQGMARQAELSAQAIGNALSHVRALTESLTGGAQGPPKRGDGGTR